jgi:hypothetical protein
MTISSTTQLTWTVEQEVHYARAPGAFLRIIEKEVEARESFRLEAFTSSGWQLVTERVFQYRRCFGDTAGDVTITAYPAYKEQRRHKRGPDCPLTLLSRADIDNIRDEVKLHAQRLVDAGFMVADNQPVAQAAAVCPDVWPI